MSIWAYLLRPTCGGQRTTWELAISLHVHPGSQVIRLYGNQRLIGPCLFKSEVSWLCLGTGGDGEGIQDHWQG